MFTCTWFKDITDTHPEGLFHCSGRRPKLVDGLDKSWNIVAFPDPIDVVLGLFCKVGTSQTLRDTKIVRTCWMWTKDVLELNVSHPRQERTEGLLP